MAQFRSFRAVGEEMLRAGYTFRHGVGKPAYNEALAIAGRSYVDNFRHIVGNNQELAGLKESTILRRPDHADKPLLFSAQIRRAIQYRIIHSTHSLEVGIDDGPYRPDQGYGSRGKSITDLVVGHELGTLNAEPRPIFGHPDLIRFSWRAAELFSDEVIRNGLTIGEKGRARADLRSSQGMD